MHAVVEECGDFSLGAPFYTTMEPSTFFSSTSPTDAPPSLITVSFAQEPNGTLGAQLKNLDKGDDSETFNPAYAAIDRLIHGDTIAKRCGLIPGDCIVAINGQGFRRFAPDYVHNNDIDELTTNLDGSINISLDSDTSNGGDDNDDDAKKEKRLKYRVIPTGMIGGEAYDAVIREIKEVKNANDPKNPLILSLERYGWDSRVNSWPRFLAARKYNVPQAMKMVQSHEQWKQTTFPIDLRRPGLRVLLNSKAIAEVEFQDVVTPPTVCIHFGKLISMDGIVANVNDIRDAFIIYTEILLAQAPDPSRPRINQFIDVSDVNMKNLKASILTSIYNTFEPNYPETLNKMVMYPVSKVMRKSITSLLNFVNEDTRKKFVLTDDLSEVCLNLGWYQPDVTQCGGVFEFIKRNHKDNKLVL